MDSYLHCLTKNNYPRYEYLDRVKRISQLARRFVNGAKHITSRIVEFFDKSIKDEVEQKNYYHAIELLKIFVQYNLIEPSKKEQHAILCQELVVKLEESEMWREAEEGYEVAVQYFSTADQKKSLLASFASLCVKLSKIAVSIQKLNYVRKAITLYREAGSILHKDVIESLELQLPELTRSVWEGKIKPYPVKRDITDIITPLKNALLNTSLKDKVVQLSSIDNFLDRNEAISFIKQRLQGSFLESGIAIAEVYDGNLNLQHTSKNDDADNFARGFHILKNDRYADRALSIEFISATIMHEHNPTLLDFKYLMLRSLCKKLLPYGGRRKADRRG